MQTFKILCSPWLEILRVETELVEQLVKFVLLGLATFFLASPYTLTVDQFGWNSSHTYYSWLTKYMQIFNFIRSPWFEILLLEAELPEHLVKFVLFGSTTFFLASPYTLTVDRIEWILAHT